MRRFVVLLAMAGCFMLAACASGGPPRTTLNGVALARKQ